MTQGFRYRPDVDGLRAVAVLAVVLFHAGFGCPGGFVGVDVFFVISGFLITSLIWNDLEGGRFTLVGFWERRARRIVPAMVVVTLVTLGAAFFLMLPQDLKGVAHASASQALFAANLYYWLTTNYFADVAGEKPLLHTWSLAVEEQFYLIVPFLLWGLYRATRLRRRTVVVSLLGVLFALSFAWSVRSVAHSPTAAFYLLPSRAWELLMGALVALVSSTPSVLDRRVPREILAVCGLALVLVPIFTDTSSTPFPGLAALFPCLGAALLILTGGRTADDAPTAVGKLLATRPLVFVGLISYSLYLWHWPFLVFGNYLALTPLPAGVRAAILGAAFVAAVLSWRYVETPFRTRKLAASRRSMLALAGTALTVVLGCSVLSLAAQRWRARAQPLEYTGVAAHDPYENQLSVADIRAGRLVALGAKNPTLPPQVLVWGDSHAMAALPAVDALLQERGLAGRAATHSATAPVLGFYKVQPWGLGQEAVAYNDAVVSYVQSQKIPDVILVAYWESYQAGVSDGPDAQPLGPALVATVKRLSAVGARAWVVLDVPIQPFSVPKALFSPVYSRAYVNSLRTKSTTGNEFTKADPMFAAEVEAAGGHVLDPKPRFLEATGRQYVLESQGVVLYRDEHHLTPKGADLMLLPLFRDAFPLGR